MEFVMAEYVSQGALCKSFVTALLITGSVKHAEAAVLESISKLKPNDGSDEALLWMAVEVSVASRGEVLELSQEELEHTLSILPFELLCVLHLAADLRYCFVCRILLGLPREACASLLRLELQQLDERTCAAMLSLVTLSLACPPTIQ
jgi:hypothetical protein